MIAEAQVHDLPQPYGAILEAIQAAENLSAARHRRVEQLADAIKELHDENGELRAAILALSNRIEAVMSSRTPSTAWRCALTGCNVSHSHVHNEEGAVIYT